MELTPLWEMTDKKNSKHILSSDEGTENPQQGDGIDSRD